MAEIIHRLKKINLANKFSTGIDNNTISWFTDGSCHNNGKKDSYGGFAAICVSGCIHERLIYGKVNDRSIRATNIRAEGTAIIEVLKYLENHSNSGWDRAVIYTDSEFWIKMIYSYMPKWDKGAFDKKANPDMTKLIWALYNSLNKKKVIDFIHVYAHNKDNSANSSDPYKRFCHDNNALADELANTARDLSHYRVVLE